MTKTEYLEDAIEREFARAIESGETIALEVDGAEYARANPGVTFPSPAAECGTIRHVAMQNPKRRWWSFWRPRVLVLTIEIQQSAPTVMLGSAIATEVATGALVADTILLPGEKNGTEQ